MRVLALILVLIPALTACGRPLTPNERAFVAGLHGDSFDPAPVRIHTSPLIGLNRHRVAARPRVTCIERIHPPLTEPYFETATAGITLFNHLTTSPAYAARDYLHGAPDSMHLGAAMYLAHEMTHVWQWQNRAITHYHPLRAAAEHKGSADPYLFDPETTGNFLDYGYEQQASLVEEYVCCRALDPDGARTERLEKLLSAVMPIAPSGSLPRPESVQKPWKDVETKGICSQDSLL